MGAVLLLNLILGGVIRIRKGWRHAGNLISHFGIIFMLVGGGVFIAMYVSGSFSAAAWFTGVTLLVFAGIGRAIATRERAAIQSR